MSFLRRPRLKVNEIFSSYLLRLTQENGYSNYQAILDYVGINSDLHKLNYLSIDEADLTVLGQMAQIEEAQLWNTIYPAIADRKIKAYGSVLDYEWLEREKIKICPSCFATNGYYHKHWSLWCYTSCHFHQCLLVDRCPQCQSVWKWDDLKNDWKCKCGWNFSETPIYKIQPEENSLSKLVACCCELVEAESIASDRKSPLSSLSLSQISLLMISTALSLHNPGDSLYQLQLPSTNQDLHALLSKSALLYKSESKNLSYFIEWFDRFYQLEYKRFGQRKNHLQKLSLVATFRRKLEDLHLE
ncbi:MAG: TniQ family protein [Pleurocapsa sp. MO_226.B13]|nr:TniQ family protein [Pleurocapsa sp. MO_226.B13]